MLVGVDVWCVKLLECGVVRGVWALWLCSGGNDLDLVLPQVPLLGGVSSFAAVPFGEDLQPV